MSAQKKKLAAKYIVRRFLLLVLAAGVLGLFCWMAARIIQRVRGGPASSAAESASLPAGSSEPPGDSESDAGQETSGSNPIEPESSSLNPAEPETEEEPQEPEPIEPAAAPATADPGDWSLILVNDESPLLPDFAPPKLAHIVGEHSVDSRIAESVNRMFAAAKANGISLVLCAAYQPDEGELQTGLAVDIASTGHREPDEGFADTPAFRWLSQHAWEYGFVLRFPKNKTNLTGTDFAPWRYRYVGDQNARRMVENDYCLEEYIYVLNQEKLRAAQEALEPEDESAESSQEE